MENQEPAALIRGNAVIEFIRKNREGRKVRNRARLVHAVDYVFYGLYALLILRLAVAVVASGSNAGVVLVIVQLAAPFLVLFHAFVPGSVLPILIAMLSLVMVRRGLQHLLRTLDRRSSDR